MPTMKFLDVPEISAMTSMVGDAVTGAKDFAVNHITPGPLSDLHSDKHGYTSLEFPQDIQGPGQRHFIRFNIVTIKGASFEAPAMSSVSPTETTT